MIHFIPPVECRGERRSRGGRGRGLITFVLAAALASAAHAQSIDYGGLEKLFGEAVTTSVTGTPQRVSEVPADMVIVTQEDIRRSGASDIPGVLSHVAGIDVMQSTNGQTDIGLRGYDQVFSARLLVLVNGRQVYADFYGMTTWSSLPVELSTIRQIEIVKGPSSALFGFNAADGVINIVTYDPGYDAVNAGSVTGGTQDLVQGSGAITLNGDGEGVRLSGGRRTDHDFSTPIPESFLAAGRAPEARNDADLDGVVRLGDSVRLRIEASHTRTVQDEVSPLYTFVRSDYTTSSVKGQLAADTRAGLVTLTAYTNWLGAYVATPTFIANFQLHNRLTVTQAEDIFKLGTQHSVRLSAEYRETTETTTPFLGGEVFRRIASGGAMWTWQIGPTLSLTNAVRVDRLMPGRTGAVPAGYPFTNSDWDRPSSPWSFNSALVWRVDAADTLRIAASRGVQVPSLYFIGGFVYSSSLLLTTGDPGVQPSVVSNCELGWDRDLAGVGAQLHASLFHQSSTHILSDQGAGFIPTPSGVYATPATVGDSRATGLELGISAKLLAPWRWGASLRYELIDDRFIPGATDGRAFVDYEHTAPRVLANANLGWSEGKWEADGFLRFASQTSGLQQTLPTSILVHVPNRVTLDARVGYKLTARATVAISGQNLNTATQRETSGPAVERRVMGTVAVSF